MTAPATAFIALFFGSLSAFSANEADTLRLPSEISEVTVFFGGAQVGRTANLKLAKGTHTIALNNLPDELDPASIQAAAPEGTAIISVRHAPQSRSLNPKSKDQKTLETDIEKQKRHIKSLKSEIAVYDIEERIMIDNSRLGTRDGVSAVDEIRAAADLYRSRLNEIRKAKMTLQVEIDAANETLKASFADFNKLNFERQLLYSEIVITLECKSPLNADLVLSYFVPSAGWEPLYDFRVSDINSPLSMVYNANVYQSTGEDWDDVKLTLSSVNPEAGTDRPELSPWLISYRKKVEPVTDLSGTGELRGSITDADTDEPLPFANLLLTQDGKRVTGSTTDFDGNFIIKPLKPGTYTLRASYVGYQTLEMNGVLINREKITFQDLKLEPGTVLHEVEVVQYSRPMIDKDGGASGGTVSRDDMRGVNMRGARAENEFYYVDGIKVQGSSRMPGRSSESMAATVGGVAKREQNHQYILFDLDEYDSEDFIANTTGVNVVNLEYAIDIPFTVRSDGRDYQLKIKETRVPVEYVYHAVPKMNPAAFLTANIGDRSVLNLLSGTASIYFKGTFTGNTYVDASQTADTITLSLGPDRSVAVERTGNRELKDKRFIGSNIRETQAWKLGLRNNRQEPVKVILYDQYPVSELRSVQVSLESHDEAEVDEKTGELRWEIQLESDSSAERKFMYELRYPKGNAALLR